MLVNLKFIKDVARKITPNCIWRTLSFIKVMLLARDAKGLNSITFLKNKDQAIVLGNGPSLKKDIDKIAEVADEYDFICVNNFATSPYYTKLMPVSYVFLDGYFFSQYAHPDWIKQREITFDRINKDTNWKMQIFVPMSADKSILTANINNPNVEIIKFKVRAYFSSDISRVLKRYKTGYFGPFQCNVLIYALYLAVWKKYQKIEIFGADMNFHNNLVVDQYNNDTYFIFQHFDHEPYKERCMKNPLRIEPFKMAEIMQTTADTFMSHDIIHEFARVNGVKIINKSSFSMIDAYSRKEEDFS